MNGKKDIVYLLVDDSLNQKLDIFYIRFGIYDERAYSEGFFEMIQATNMIMGKNALTDEETRKKLPKFINVMIAMKNVFKN